MIETIRFESLRELREWALSEDRGCVVGDQLERTTEYLGLLVQSGPSAFLRVGVVSEGHGLRPAVYLRRDCVLVGFGACVKQLTLPALTEAASVSLLSLFYEFLADGVVDNVCVLCETAVVCLNPKCEVVWRVDTDIIVDWRRKANNLHLTLFDGPPLEVDLQTGQSRKLPRPNDR